MRFFDPRSSRFMTLCYLSGLMILSTCSVNQVGLGAKVDITPPKVQITSPSDDGQYIRGDLIVSGTASDDLGIKDFTITYPSAAGGDVLTKLAVSGGVWSVTIPTGTASGLPEGKVSITAAATDKSGKTTSDTLLVYVDNKAPTVLITAPINYAALAKDAPQYTDSLDIKGEVYDPSPVPKGSVKVRLLHWDRTPVPTPEHADGWTVADGTNTFSVRFLLKNGLLTPADDTKGFYYEVQATDQAGNVNGYYYHRNDIYDVLPANTIFPAMNELGQIDQAGQGQSPVSFIPYTASASTKGVTKGLVDIQLTNLAKLANFQYSAVSKPKIKFSNFDQSKLQYQNPLAGNSVVNGTITPDANGGAIDPKSVSIEYWSPNAITGTKLVTITDSDNTNMSDNIELLGFGDSLVFTVNLKNGTTPLPPGPYSIKVTATAKGSNPQSETGDFVIDDNAPILVETGIGTGALTPKKSAFTLSGTARAGAQMDKIKIYQAKDPASVDESTDAQVVQSIDLSNTALFPVNTDNNWTSAPLPIASTADGTYYFVVKLLSMSGKTSSVFRTILYDAAAPVLDVTSPVAGTWVSTLSPTIKGTADDGNGTGVDKVWVLVDADSVSHASDSAATVAATWTQATGTASWTYTPTISTEGKKTLWVASQDKAGNWTTTYTQISFGVDLAAPTLTSNKTDFGGLFIRLPINVTGTAADFNGIQKLDYSLDGGNTYSSLSSTTTTSSTPINWSTSIPLPAGVASEVRNVRLRATDQAGKETSDQFSVTVDTLAPTFSVGNLVDTQLVTSSPFTVSGNVSDNGGSGSPKIHLSLDNGSSWTDAIVTGSSWSADLTTADGLSKTLKVRSEDAVGNVSPDTTISFKLDSILPDTDSNQTPAAFGGTYQTAAFTLSGTANDNLGVASVAVAGTAGAGVGSLTLGGGTLSRTWSVPITPSVDGVYTYTITVTDVAGRTKVYTNNVVYDTTNPDVSVANLSLPPATNALSNPAYEIKGSATDDNGLQSLSYQIDGGTWTGLTAAVSWSVPVSGLLGAEGSHTIRFMAVDKAGNSVTYPALIDPPLQFGLDLAPPTLTSNASILHNSNQKSAFVLNGTAQDNNHIQLLEYSLDGGTTWATIAGTSTDSSTFGWSQNVAVAANGSDDGLKAVRIRATDGFGKTTTDSASVRFDATAPSLSVNNLTNGQLVGSLSFSAMGTVGDNGGSGVAPAGGVQFSIDGGTTWNNAVVTGSSWTASLSLTEKLGQRLLFRATDVVGNVTVPSSGTTDLTVNVDIAAPTISNVTIPSGFSKQNFLMNFDLADSLDLASVTVTQSLNGGTPVNIPLADYLSGPSDTSKINLGTTLWGLEPFPRDPNDPTTKLLAPEGEFEYVITVTDAAGRPPVSVTRKLTVDSVAPSVSIINPTASATVNGRISVNAAASDANGIQNVKYLYRAAADASALPDYTTWTDMGSAPYATVLDTSGLADGAWVLYVGAQDKAGNQTVDVSIPFTTFQAGDIPTITLTNMNTSATSLALASANLFNSASVTLTATAGDDDDIDRNAVLVWVGIDSDPAPVTDGEFSNVSARPAADGKNVSFSHTFTGLPEGAKKLYVRIKDKAASKLGLAATTTTIGPVYFAFDSADPTLTVTNKATYDGKAVNANFSLNGTTSDNNGVAKLEFSFDGGATWPTVVSNPTASWTQLITVPAAGADDGIKNVRVRATDGFGKTTTQAMTVTFDTLAPTTPSIAAFSSTYFDAQLNASGTTSDATSGVNKVQYSTDNVTWTDLTGQDNWFGSVTTSNTTNFPEGTNTLFVRAIDRAGNISSLGTQVFVIDRSSPVITESGYSGTVYKNNDFLFSVDVADSLALNANALTVGLKVNGTDVATPTLAQTTISSKHHTYDFTVPKSYLDGIYTITLNAVDSVGRSALPITRTVIVDTVAPSLTIGNLADGDLLTSAASTILGTANDGAGSGIKKIQYSLDGGIWTDTTGSSSWAAALTGLTDGLSHSIVFQAEDNSGNVSDSSTLAARTRAFKVDLALPALAESTSGISNASLVYRNTAVTIGGTTTDANTVSHLTVAYQKDGGSVLTPVDDIDNNGVWTYAMPFDSIGHTADGLYELTVTATDGAGRISTLQRKIQIDTKSPDLTITAPIASELVDVTGYTIRGQINDNGGKGISTLEYSKNSTNGTDGTWTNITLSGLNWSVAGLDFSAGGQGAKTLWVRSSDGLNPVTTASQNFNYDTDVPTLSETTVATANQVIRAGGFSFSGKVADTNSLSSLKISATQDGTNRITNAAITFDADGPDNVIHNADDGPWTYTHPVNAGTHADDGLWVFTLTGTDVAGRTVSLNRTVLVDTTVPTVTTDALTDPYYETTLSASGSAGDSNGGVTVSGLQKVEYSLDGTNWFTATGTDSWAKTLSITSLPVGTASLRARATDRAGNVSTEAVAAFTVDRSIPGIGESSYSGSVARNADFAFSVNLTDDLGLATNALSVILKVEGVTQPSPAITKNAATGTNDNYTFTVPAIYGDGTYQVTLNAIDGTGRTSSLIRSVLVDKTLPTVAVSYPAANDVVSSSSITVAGTASDGAGSGLQQVEYSLDGTNWFGLNGTSNWNKTVALGGEGVKTLRVRATDNVSQITAPVATISFSLDQTPPSLTETDLGTSSPKRSSTFTLTGDASDTNGLKTWDDPIDGLNSVLVPYVEINDGAVSQKVTVAANHWTYSYPVATDGSQDGNITFTITAEDVVGKQTTLTRIVTVDTTKPVITVDGVIGGLNVSTNQVNGTMTFRFSADDSGVGLEKNGAGKYVAYYTILTHSLTAPASTAADVASWTAIPPSSSSVFTFTTDTKLLSDGNYDLWLAVRDAVPGTPNARAFKFSPSTPSAPVAADVSLAVAQASDRPLIGFDNLNVAATQNSDNGLGKNPTILLTLQDDDKVKVSDLQYRIDINNDGLFNLTKDFWGGNAVIGADNSNADGDMNDKWEDESVWYNFEEAPASDGSLVQAKIKLTGFPQGVFGLQVRVRDNTDASTWSAIYDQGTNYSWQKSGIVPFSVDFGPPTIKVTAPLAGTYRTNLTLTGTTKDLLGVVRVRYTFDGITETTVYNNANPTVSVSSSALVAQLPYVITGLGDTNWASIGAGAGATVGTTFIASGPAGGTGLAKIDPSVEIPFSGSIDTSSLATGEYTLQVIATDIGGSDATQQIPITIDKDKPTVTFLQPGVSTTVNGASVKVSGEAADNRKVGAVFLWHGLVGAPDPALPTQTAAPSAGNPNGLYSAGGYTQLSGTGIWNTTIDTTSQASTAADGYRIRVVAIDAIGNVGVPFDQLVTVDQETDRPVVGFSNLNLVTPSRLPAGNVTIIGTVGDDDSVKANAIQIRLDRNGDGDYDDANEGWVPISDPPPSNSVVVSWSHEITDMTSQGSRHVQVRAQDTNASDYTSGYGWSVSASVAFFIDNGPPTLDLASPTIGQRFNAGQFTLTGSTNDTNGIHRIVVWVDDNDDQVKDAGELSSIVGPSVAASTIVFGHTYTVEALNGTDFVPVGGVNTPGTTFTATAAGTGLSGTGTVKASLTTDETPYPINSVISSFSNAAKSVKAVQVTSYDVSNASTTRDLSIVYDPTVPTASFNTPNEGATVNGVINVSGLGGDNYQLDNIYYNISPLAAPAPAFPAGYTSLAQSYSWNFNLDTTALTDGAYVVRIVAQDKALNNSSAAPTVRNLIVNQTSDRPVFAVLTLNEAGTAVDNLLPASLQISGTVSDDDAVDRTRIQIRSRTLPAGSFGAWTAISGPPASNVSLATWNHTFTGFTDGQYEFELRAGDIHDLGNWATFSSGTSTAVKFAVDLNLPTGSILAPTQGSAKRANFTINGTAADASGIKKVSIAYDVGGGYGAETLLVNDTNAADGYLTSTPWTTNYLVTGSNDGQTFYRVTITDAFDKVRTYEQYFTVDTTAPTNAFQLPSAGSTLNGSVEMRGSSTDAGAITKVYAKVLNGTDPGNWAPGTTPESEGWTLINGTYNWTYRFKSTTLTDGAATIFVMAEDAGGNRSNPTLAANQLSFTVNQATNLPVITLSTSNNALLDNSGTVTGTITDDDGVDVSTLQISFDNGSTWRSVSSPGTNGLTVNFSHALSAGAGLVQSATPYQVLVKVSDVGENFDGGNFAGPQDIAPVTQTSTAISIKKDDDDPVAVVATLDNGLGPVANLQGAYLNSRLTLAGTATDGVGVSTVEARLVGVAAFSSATSTGTNFSTWTWAQTGLSLAGSSVSLEVKVTDVNGRSTTQSYTLLVDTTVPTVSFESTALNPDTATGTYNGTATFRGGAADNVLVNKVYYRFAASDPGAPDASFSGWTLAGSTYSWTAPLNTTLVNNTAADAAYQLWAVSVDGAGNASTRQSLSFTINQGSDRPVVTITAPTAAQVFDVNAKAQGTVIDDDGLATIEVRIDRDNDGTFGNIANETYVPVSLPVTVSGKSLNLEHVLSTLSDGKYKLQFRVRDSLFVSTGATPFNEYETGVIDYSIDTAPPSLSLTKITVQDRYPADGKAVAPITSDFNGKSVNNDLTFEFNASDASGIASVQVSTDGSVWSNATHGAGAVYTYALTIPLNQSFDGTKNIQYRTTDANGKVTSAIVTLIVDTKEPDIGFTSPTTISPLITDEAPNANGSVTVFGTVSDSSSISTVDITVGKGTPHALTNIGNNLAWKVTFPATTYQNATDATETPGGSNVWRLPVTITAYESAGNSTVMTGYIDLDPNGDKPIVAIASPAANASTTGIITLTGSVSDDDGTSGTVDIDIDANNNGSYADGADQHFTDVTVANGAWSQQINTGATLSGTIRFRVTPKDSGGIVGDALDRVIFIDNSLPVIVGYNGSAETAAPTPLTGTKQSGTIAVRALFKDDDNVAPGNLQVSLDGGTTYVAISTQPGYSLNQLADAGGKKRYDVQFLVNTATYFTNNSGNGSLSIILQITDNTYKPAVVSMAYAADNRPPEALWNYDSSLTASSGVYSFSGTGTLNNKFIGSAKDGGSVSGVSYVDLFFVKGGNLLNPKTGTGIAAPTAVTADNLYTQISFTAGNVNAATNIFTVDRTGFGTVNNTLPVRFIGGALPSGLDEATLYYIRDVSGNTFAVYTSPTGGTAVDIGSGGGQLEYALTGVPFTTDAYTAGGTGTHYAVRIDKRTELGSNDTNANGDGDGFEESLKDKGGYDEWFTYLNTTVLPDGPLTIYFVTSDENGNKVIGSTNGQITNNPPSVTAASVNGSAVSASPWKIKTGSGAGSSIPVVLTATDTGVGANIAATGWKLEVLSRWGNGSDIAASAETTYSGWFYGTGGVRTFSATGSGTTLPVTATVSIYVNGGGAGQESSFTSGYWYQLRGTATDTDGNIATQSFYLKINNNDASVPVVTFPELDQTSLADWTSKTTPLSLDVPATALTAASANVGVALPTWMTVDSKVIFANGVAPAGFTPGTVYYLKTISNPFTLSASSGGAAIPVTTVTAGAVYTLVSGGHVEAKADSNYNATNDADVSGSLRFTGTASDDTDVQAVGLQINGVGATASVTGNTVTANAHGLSNGTPIYFTATTMPSNLTAGTTYYVVSSSTNTFSVATAVGGTAITTTGGTGVQFWMVANKTQTGGNVISGYTYNWSYVWDSSRISTVAANNVTVRVNALDLIANSTTVNLGTAGTVDVLPYITSITDPSGLPAAILRGSTGKYSIATSASAKLNVYGYNLGRVGATPTAWSGNAVTSYVAGGNTASVVPTPDPTYPVNLIAVPKTWTRSGYLTVTVNGVPSGNNLDNDANANNIESTSNVTTAKWTDNRFLWVWATTQVSPTSITTTSTNASLMNFYNPEMIVTPSTVITGFTTGDQPEFSFNDDNGGILAYTISNNAAVRKTGYRKMAQAGFAAANIGGTYQRFFASSFDGQYLNTDNTGFLEVSGWAGLQTTDSYTQAYGPSSPNDAIRWMTIQGNDYFSESYTTTGGAYRYLNRYPHPKMIVTPAVTNAGGANIYLSYYDASPYAQSLNYISFAYNNTATGGNSYVTANTPTITAGPRRNAAVLPLPGTSGGRSSSSFAMAKVGTTGMAVAYYDPTSTTLKVLTSTAAYTGSGTAGTENKTNLTNNVRPVTTVTISNATTPANFNGKYFTMYNWNQAWDIFFDSSVGQTAQNPGPNANSIRVNTNGIAATNAAFGAALNTALRTSIGFKDTATNATASFNVTHTDFAPATTASAGSVGVANIAFTIVTAGLTNWTVTDIDTNTNVGGYVSMVADGTNLYLAYQDGDNGQLKFARAAWTGNSGVPTSISKVKVDGAPSVPISLGSWTNIMLLPLTNVNGVTSTEPVIAYYADSYNGTKNPIRFAVPTVSQIGITTLVNGVNTDDTYTGSWDISTVQAIGVPTGGDDRFNKVQLQPYSSGTLPVLGWVATKPEYSKLQPNN